jgi:hypothetical protein
MKEKYVDREIEGKTTTIKIKQAWDGLKPAAADIEDN